MKGYLANWFFTCHVWREVCILVLLIKKSLICYVKLYYKTKFSFQRLHSLSVRSGLIDLIKLWGVCECSLNPLSFTALIFLSLGHNFYFSLGLKGLKFSIYFKLFLCFWHLFNPNICFTQPSRALKSWHKIASSFWKCFVLHFCHWRTAMIRFTVLQLRACCKILNIYGQS